MLEKIKYILHEEKLLWQDKRSLNNRDTIFGVIMMIMFYGELAVYLFCWNEIENFALTLSTLQLVLFAGFIMLSPVVLMFEMIIHLRPQ